MNKTDKLWQRAVIDLDEGNFSRLQDALGGPEGFDRQILEWHREGRFGGHDEILAEALSCACMLGRTETARFLLDAGLDPYSGMKTGLAGPHYAVSGGHLDILEMLTERKILLEIKNQYGGTLLGQALWSAVNEHKSTHAAIIELLIDSGAKIEPGTTEWWQGQDVPSPETKQRVLDALVKGSAQ